MNPSLSSSMASSELLLQLLTTSGCCVPAAGQPSLTAVSPSSFVAFRQLAPLSAAPEAGQPSLTALSPSSSRALLHCRLSSFSVPTGGQPSLISPSPSLSTALVQSPSGPVSVTLTLSQGSLVDLSAAICVQVMPPFDVWKSICSSATNRTSGSIGEATIEQLSWTDAVVLGRRSRLDASMSVQVTPSSRERKCPSSPQTSRTPLGPWTTTS